MSTNKDTFKQLAKDFDTACRTPVKGDDHERWQDDFFSQRDAVADRALAAVNDASNEGGLLAIGLVGATSWGSVLRLIAKVRPESFSFPEYVLAGYASAIEAGADAEACHLLGQVLDESPVTVAETAAQPVHDTSPLTPENLDLFRRGYLYLSRAGPESIHKPRLKLIGRDKLVKLLTEDPIWAAEVKQKGFRVSEASVGRFLAGLRDERLKRTDKLAREKQEFVKLLFEQLADDCGEAKAKGMLEAAAKGDLGPLEREARRSGPAAEFFKLARMNPSIAIPQSS